MWLGFGTGSSTARSARGCQPDWQGDARRTNYAALARGSVTLVSPLVATYPLVTVVASALLLGRIQNGITVAAGVALTVAGVGMLLVGAR